MTTDHDIIKKISEQFTEIKRDNGEWITIIKDNTPYKDILTDMSFKVHGDKLPDDFVYKTMADILGVIMNYDFDDIEELIDNYTYEIIDGQVNIYTSDLTKWLNSRADRVYYLTEALEEYGPIEDGFKLLSMAQYREIEEITFSMLQWVEDHKEELKEIIEGE